MKPPVCLQNLDRRLQLKLMTDAGILPTALSSRSGSSRDRRAGRGGSPLLETFLICLPTPLSPSHFSSFVTLEGKQKERCVNSQKTHSSEGFAGGDACRVSSDVYAFLCNETSESSLSTSSALLHTCPVYRCCCRRRGNLFIFSSCLLSIFVQAAQLQEITEVSQRLCVIVRCCAACCTPGGGGAKVWTGGPQCVAGVF